MLVRGRGAAEPSASSALPFAPATEPRDCVRDRPKFETLRFVFGTESRDCARDRLRAG